MKVKLVVGVFGRWLVVPADNPDLAWSGSDFVPHDRGLPTGGVQVSNFQTKAEALDYAKSFEFEVIED